MDSIPTHIANKVCVKKCFPDRCSYATECAYAKHVKDFKSGRYKFQIYPHVLYEKAWADGEIPLKSVIIGDFMNKTPCEPDTITLQLSEQDLFAFAHLSNLFCCTHKNIRYFVNEDTEKIKKKTRKLFDKLCDGNRKVYLKEIMGDISDFAERISGTAYPELKDNRFWLRYYKKVHNILPLIAQPSTNLKELDVDAGRRSFTFCVSVPNTDDMHPLAS